MSEQSGKKTSVGIAEKRVKYAEQIDYLIDLYYQRHPDEDPSGVRPDLVADWATKNNLWKETPATQEELLRRRIARHLRNSTYEDPKGRQVRTHHAIFVETVGAAGEVKRRSKWLKLYSALPDEILMAAQLRRKAALSDVIQLELDLASYDDYNVHGAKLPQRNYDFNADIDELKESSTYNQQPPDDDEDDDI